MTVSESTSTAPQYPPPPTGQPVISPAPVYPPPPTGQPAYGPAPDQPTYGQSLPAYMPPVALSPAPIDPRLSGAVAEYAKRQYRILSGSGGSVTMERPATRFNWIAGVLSLIVFFPVAILYTIGWLIWRVPRSYQVTLSLGPQGEVHETGDVLAAYDRDRLKAHRVRCIGFAILLAAFAGLMLIGMVGSIVAPAAGSEAPPLGAAFAGTLIVVVAPLAGAYALYNSARKAGRELGLQR